LENELEEANLLFRNLLSKSTQELKALSRKVGGSNIDKSRPYFEALEVANKAQEECENSATAYQVRNTIFLLLLLFPFCFSVNF